MPTSVNQIVNVNISLSTLGVVQAGFGIPLIVGPTGFNNADVIRYYASAAGYLADGHVTSDIEYTYLTEAFEQPIQPGLVGVGARTPSTNAVDTIAVGTLVVPHLYKFTLNGNVISCTSSSGNTQEIILTALAMVINALPSPYGTFGPAYNAVVGGSGSGALLTNTSAGGLPVVITAVDADLTHVQVTPGNNITSDLDAILQAPTGNDWYGLCVAGSSDYDVLQTAAFTEDLKKIYIAASGDAAISTSATTDIMSVLQSKSYQRTALMFSPGSYNLGIDAAWLGGQLPQVPGSNNWKFKTLAGISTDSYTATQRATLIGAVAGGVRVSSGKNANIYELVGGAGITEEGWMAGGQFIDVIVGADALQANMEALIFAQLLLNPKVPYTDKGVTVIENQVNLALQNASDNPGGSGFIDHTSIVINVLPISSVPANTRAQRILPPGIITWSCRLTGALDFIFINGTITA